MSPDAEIRLKSKQRSLRDHLTDSLRERIMSSDLSRGQRIDLPRMARDYEVSLIPLREALIVLESEGVVSSRERRGVFVPELSEEDLIEIYQVREAIEVQAVELLIASGDAAADTALSNALQELAACWKSGDHDAAVRVDLQLHCLISVTSGNLRLAQMAKMMANQTLLHLAPVEESQVALRRRPADHFHKNIVRAIVQRDVESARQAVRDHYSWAHARLSDAGLGAS